MKDHNSSERKRVKVVLAGPFPRPGGMQGTYGRILDGILSCPIFKEHIEFIPLRLTLPSEGNPLKRWFIDMGRYARVLAERPACIHYVLQRGRSLLREFPILTVSRFLGIRTIVDNRGGGIQDNLAENNHRVRKFLLRSILRNSDVLVMECVKDREFVKREFRREAAYVPNTIPESVFYRIRPAKMDIAAGEPIRIIYSGRYSTDKGVKTILQAMTSLSKRGVRAELHLTGESSDEEMSRLIREFCDTPPRGVRVVDHGWNVQDLYGLISSCHIFLMPTTHYGEGHPNSVNEAMAAGLAMILCDWRHREDVVPANGCRIVEPKNPGAIADAILYYAKNTEMLKKAGRSNRRQVETRFLDTSVMPVLLRAYLDAE